MYLAYVNIDTKTGVECFAVIGKDSEDIYRNALKYGTDPYFVSGMFPLSKYW